jgi:nucleoside-diphosphate-sugar epimerase
VIVHQLTDLPRRFAELRKGTPGTDRLRREGTGNLVDAAIAAGARRIVAESIAFAYAPRGPRVLSEDAPLWLDAPGRSVGTIEAVAALEATVTGTPGIEGVVLRYGSLYGPGTWFAADGDLAEQVRKRRLPIVGGGGGMNSFLHVADAAAATVCAAQTGAPGIYNVADDEPVPYSEFLPAYAELLGAEPPRRMPAWLVRLAAGPAAVASLTQQRGAANAKAKAGLGWQPRWASWRDGFAAELSRTG